MRTRLFIVPTSPIIQSYFSELRPYLEKYNWTIQGFVVDLITPYLDDLCRGVEVEDSDPTVPEYVGTIAFETVAAMMLGEVAFNPEDDLRRLTMTNRDDNDEYSTLMPLTIGLASALFREIHYHMRRILGKDPADRHFISTIMYSRMVGLDMVFERGEVEMTTR